VLDLLHDLGVNGYTGTEVDLDLHKVFSVHNFSR
jgi:hypothetical protein